MITKEQVKHIATLARIQLTEQEIEKFQKDFSSILEYFRILDALDVSGVEPMTHSIRVENVVRFDDRKKQEADVAEKVIALAPQTKERFVKVTSVF